jgi:hypothetical protein
MMRRSRSFETLAIAAFCGVANLGAAESTGKARNPIIHADVPDMSMVRVGDTDYNQQPKPAFFAVTKAGQGAHHPAELRQQIPRFIQ